MDYQTIPSAASPEVPNNENWETANYSAIYGKRQPVTTGLTWGYCGGRWSGFSVSAGTLSLTNNDVNYISVERATGVISTEVAIGSPPIPTHWNNTSSYARVYKITCAGGLVTAVEDHRAGSFGVHGPASAGGGLGDVVGPSSAVDNRVAFFDGTTGKLIKDSGLTLSGSNTGDQTAGHAIEDEGSGVTQRATLNFVGAGVAVTDAGGKTVVTIGGGSPGGSDTQIQFNDSSAFGGDADLTWNKTTNVLTFGVAATPATLRGPDGVGAGTGTGFTLLAGTGGTSSAAGGAIAITGGAGGTPNGSGNTVTVSGGTAFSSGFGSGGAVTIQGGVAGATGAGGQINILGSNSGTSNSGGKIVITAGSSSSAPGRNVEITASTGSGGGNAGGDIVLTSGGGGGVAGAVRLVIGVSSAGIGGAIVGTSGTGSGANAGGAITWTAGTGGSSGAAGGVATLQGGLGLGTGSGGAAKLLGGTAGSTGTAGGLASVIGGTPIAGAGGGVAITGADGVGTNKDGGTVTITAGAKTGGGTDGLVIIAGADRVLRINGQTTGGASNTGTLGTAPTAGDPGFWLKVNIGGTNYQIPCWAG